MQLQTVRFLRANFPFSKSDVAGLPMDKALLLRKHGAVEFIEPKEPEPAPANVAPDGLVEIPADWPELHHKTRMSIASQIAARRVASAEEADSIIVEELGRRRHVRAQEG